MKNFLILKTGEIKSAYSIKDCGNIYIVNFTKDGNNYRYKKSCIQVLDSPNKKNETLPFIVYSVPRRCWNCNKEIELLTYITYKDNPKESITYPWDRQRLLKRQNWQAHMLDGRNGEIEYYGIHVLGEIEEYNSLIMQKFPDRIKILYSKTQNMSYPMNICQHCGAKQGWFFLFEEIDKHIKRMEELKIVTT